MSRTPFTQHFGTYQYLQPPGVPRSLSTSMPAGPWIHVLCSHYLAIFFIAQYFYVSVYVMPLALSFLHFGWQNSNPVVFCMGRTAHLKYSRVRFGEGNGTHSSVLAWRIPGTGEPGGLPSMGSHRVGHDWSDLAAKEIEKVSDIDIRRGRKSTYLLVLAMELYTLLVITVNQKIVWRL